MYLVAMTFVHTLLEAFYAEYTGGIYCTIPGNTYQNSEDMVTPVLYFLHLNTLDIILLIVNISFADDAFYK